MVEDRRSNYVQVTVRLIKEKKNKKRESLVYTQKEIRILSPKKRSDTEWKESVGKSDFDFSGWE